MKTPSKLFAGSAAVATLALLAGCSTATAGADTDTDAAGESPRIGVFVLATANAYSQQNIAGAEKAAEEFGAEIEVFDGAFSGPTQLAQIQDALATGEYDGFVIFPNDGAAVVPGVEEAAAEGVPSVAAYAPIGTSTSGEPTVEGVVGTVWHPNELNGVALGELAVEACAADHPDAEPCTVGYISGGNAILFEKLKLDAFKQTLADSGEDIEVVAQQEGNFLTADARTAAENILQANPDIDVIVATGDQMTIGAQQAVDDAGATDVSLIGNGAAEEGVVAVAAGEWFGSPVFLPIDEGYEATKMLLEFLAGTEPANAVINVVDLSNVGPVVTKENAAEFTAQWSAAG